MISYFINSIEGLLTGSIPVNSIDCENTTPTSGSFSVRGTLDPNNSDILLVKENKTTKTAGVQPGMSFVVTGSGKITNDDYQLLMKTLSQGRSLSKTQFESTSDFIIWKIPFSNGFLTYGHFYRLNAHKYYVFASQKNYSLTDLSACLDSKGVGYTDVIRINAGSPVQNTGVGDSIGCCFFSESYTPFDRSMLRFGGVFTYSISNDKVMLSWSDTSIGLPFNEFLDTLNIGDPEIEEKDDEYGNYSTSGGYGGGSFDDSSDAFGLPSLPSLGVSEVGFVNVYNPTKNEMLGFADELFPDYEKPTPSQKEGLDGVVENLANVTNVIGFLTDSYINKGLIDFVIDCHIVPVTPTTTSSTGIKVGFKTFEYNPKKVVRDYVEFDCGSLSIPEYYQNFLDYMGTRAKLYCPFIGFVDVKPEWFQSGVLQLIYHFNVIDGSCIAFLIGTSSKSNLKNTVVATFGGNCCVHMPITGLNYSSMITGIVAGGASIIGSAANKDLGGMARGVTEMLSAKPSLEQSNGYNAGMSYMCYRQPYLLIERPVASFSKNYPHEEGLPLNVTKKLSSVSGFTTCEAPVLDGLRALDEEKEMIRAALADGIIL
mgnify:CR=1 FL=1